MRHPFPVAADIAVDPKTITPLQRLSLYENILQVEPNCLEPGHCLLAWVYQLLLELPWLTPEAINLIIRRCRDDIILAGTAIEFGMNAGDSYMLVFAERNFCTWTGGTGYLDLKDGSTCKQVPVTPMESIAYNLVELFRRNAARCKDAIKRQGQ